MSPRSIVILGSATALALVLAVATSLSWSTRDAVSQRGAALLPALNKRVGDIALISVQTDSETMTIKRDGDTFTDGSSGYPVKREAVRNLVASVVVMGIEEKKTGDASRHGELDLAAPDQKDGAGTKISFLSKDGSVIGALIAGKNDYTVGGVSGGQYVRSASDDQTYLVRGSAKLPYSRAAWFDTKLLEVKTPTIVRASLTANGTKQVALTKVGEVLKLVDLPEGKVEDSDKISRISKLFESLSFADVRAHSKDMKADGNTVTIGTDEGLSVTIASVEQNTDETHWVRISLDGSEPKVKDRAEALAKRLDGFEFKLSKQNSEVIGWSVADLTKDAQS
ncbi:MAG: DUF4340 domain-containing protein [Rhizobiales bacterium]|nr:DUF4340 domain-containing protein [Hyphomicrobiales bacterium]